MTHEPYAPTVLYETSQALTDRLEKHYRKKQERQFTKTNNNNKMEEVTCFKLCYPRPQVTLHKKKLGPVPEGLPEERESSPHLSMVSARVSSSGAHRQRYTHSHKASPSFPRYQFTNSHGQPEGGGGRVLHCCHPRCPRSGTINIIIWGRSSARQRAETGNTDQTITSLKNKQI